MKNSILIIGLLLLFGVSQSFAQEKSKKKVVIIKEKVDKDGKKTKKRVITETDEDEIIKFHTDGEIHVIIDEDGEEEKFIIQKNKDMMIDGDQIIQNINVNVNENDGEKEIEIRIKGKDGKEEVIEWKGTGDIPEDIQRKMEELEIQMHNSKMGKVHVFHHDDNSGFLGVRMENEDDSAQGVLVSSVVEDSAAEEAGIKAGDLLKKVNGKNVQSIDEVIKALKGTKAGDQVEVVLLRNGQEKTLNATLKQRTDQIFIQDIEIDSDMDFDFDNEMEMDVIIEEKDGKKTIQLNGQKIIVEKIVEDGEEEVKVEIEELPETTPQVNFLQEIDIFPNPTDGILKIRFAAAKKPTIIKITDTSGKAVFSKNLQNFDGQFEEEINLRNAASGALILSIEQEGEVFTEQIILK